MVQLKAQLAATQASRVRNDEHVIVTAAESVQRRDPPAWNKMTIPQRLTSVGVDPNVDKAECTLLGKNSDQKAASDLMRVDQRRYNPSTKSLTSLAFRVPSHLAVGFPAK